LRFPVKNEYLATALGFGLFFVFLIVLSSVNQYFEEIWKENAAENFTMPIYKITFYKTCVQLFFYPLMIASLGLARIVRADYFHWKLFALYFAVGVFTMFAGYIFNFPMDTSIKFFLLLDLSPWGSTIIGIGLIVAAKTEHNPK